jgi:hypothetical protein
MPGLRLARVAGRRSSQPVGRNRAAWADGPPGGCAQRGCRSRCGRMGPAWNSVTAWSDDPGFCYSRTSAGQVVVGLWRRVGQCRGVVVVVQVGAGLPLPVLSEVLFPARDAEQFMVRRRCRTAVSPAGPGTG